jgi:hypothetical protein
MFKLIQQLMQLPLIPSAPAAKPKPDRRILTSQDGNLQVLPTQQVKKPPQKSLTVWK